MTPSSSQPQAVDVGLLHQAHPEIKAEDWRPALIRRVSGSDTYADGSGVVRDKVATDGGQLSEGALRLTWGGMRDDFRRYVRTYQDSVITEHAALAMCCVLLTQRLGRQIVEVTRRGERADYWLDGYDELLEVSGQQGGSLDSLFDSKRAQLLANPHGASGYVCVSDFAQKESRLAYCAKGAR